MDLTGKVLVARPSILDPMFTKSVVFIHEHSTRGTAGLILNKRLATNTKDICASKGFEGNFPREPVYSGGPVNTRGIVLFHSADWRVSNTMRVNSQCCISSDDMMLFKYTQGDTPRYYRFFAGMSIWHPAQIQQEIKANNWLITQLDIDTIFETDHRHLWDIAVESAAQEMMDKFI
jgi:putative transcriptional regulator